jgi:CHAT domain-containing protein/Flp pilus assembly protein TadD
MPVRRPTASAAVGLSIVLAAAGSICVPTPAAAQDPRAHEAEALERRGELLEAQGQFAAAVESWRRALALRQAMQDRGGEARLAGTIGVAYFGREDYATAIEYLRPFLGLTRDLGERRAEGVALTYLGNSRVFLGRYTHAASDLLDALPVVRQFDDERGEGVVLAGLGTAQFHLGLYVDARRSFDRLLQIGRSLGDEPLSGFALLGIGHVADALGDSRTALDLYGQALRLAQRSGDRRTEGRAHGGLGNVYLGRGDHAAAREHYDRSLAIARSIGDREGEANAHGNLGNLYSLTDRRQEAQREHEQSLAIARARRDRQGEMDSLIGIGLASERAGDGRAAISAYQRTYHLAREARNRPAAVIALTNLGGALVSAGRPAEGEQALRDALLLADSLRAEDLEDVDRVRLFETHAVAYRHLLDLLARQQRDADALLVAERGRAQALRVLLAKRLASGEGTALRVERPLSLQDIRQVATDRRATLVAYAIADGGKELLAWVVQPDGNIRMRRSRLDSPLAEIVSPVRESLGAAGLDRSARTRGIHVVADDAAGAAPQLQRLHRLLIEPILELLPAREQATVILIPDQELHLVPFAAILDGNGRYLVDRFSLQISPSIDALRFTSAVAAPSRAADPGKRLVVGNPLMPQVHDSATGTTLRLPSLPGTEREAKAVAELLGTRPLMGADATKPRVVTELVAARVAHLATHGLLDDFGSGVPGAVALAPGPGDDGLLTAVEISALRLSAEVVVLSACDTGRGNLTGEGVIGLARALLVAGAASTVVSLWQVPDEPTASLMISFYEHQRKGAGKAEALRAAMIDTRQRYPGPANWAAFVLVGDAPSR